MTSEIPSAALSRARGLMGGLARLVVGVVVGGAIMFGSVLAFQAFGPDENEGQFDSGREIATGESIGEEVSAGPAIRVAIEAPATLDPALAREELPGDMLLADLLYDGLTALALTGGEVVPALALDWSVSGDGKTWTFELDPERTFSNGDPVTASAVVSSLERVIERGTDVLANATLERIVLMETEGTQRVVIVLDTPAPELPAMLADPVFGVVAPASSFDGGSLPVASGPYLIGGVSAETWLMSRRAGFTSGPDAIAFMRLDSLDSAYAALLAGEAEVALVPTLSRGDVPGELTVESTLGPVQSWIGANLANPDLADVRVRRAVMSAVDPSAIVGSWTQPVGDVFGRVCAAPCGADRTGAAALVAELEAERGSPLSVRLDVLARDEQVATAVTEQLVGVGIDVEVAVREPAEFAEMAASGELSVFVWGITPIAPGPAGALPRLFGSTSVDNVFGLASYDVDASLAAGLYDQTASLLTDGAVARPLGLYERSVAMQPGIGGVVFDAAGRLRLDAAVVE